LSSKIIDDKIMGILSEATEDAASESDSFSSLEFVCPHSLA
jgi:hypothetical protein